MAGDCVRFARMGVSGTMTSDESDLGHDGCRLLLPEQDEPRPELSIVVPALNEELAIGRFVDWCREGLSKVDIRAEILIVDSSTDRTAEIALARGARVLKTPRRGLGRAYIDALGYARGRYLLLGDCDCTYDFREIAPFVEKFREGYEYIMGSRFRGEIEPGAMPPLHQYLGTPVTTWILNRIYSSSFTDIHCGMRGITREALKRMDLRSQSWQYASEMVLKSVHMKLRTAEVPIRFLKEPPGRESHMKRRGWLEPWKAAWINLQAMFVYGADFFLLKPGLLLLLVGALLTLPLSLGPIQVGRMAFSLFWMLLGMSLSIVGLQAVYLGILARVILDFTGGSTATWTRVFRYNRAVVTSLVLALSGTALTIPFVLSYIRVGFSGLAAGRPANHLAVLGLFLLIAAFMHFTAALLIHAAAITSAERLRRSA